VYLGYMQSKEEMFEARRIMLGNVWY